MRTHGARAAEVDILLAIEVAATGWAIDAERRRPFVRSGPSPAGWRTIFERSQDEILALAAPPGFSARLATM